MRDTDTTRDTAGLRPSGVAAALRVGASEPVRDADKPTDRVLVGSDVGWLERDRVREVDAVGGGGSGGDGVADAVSESDAPEVCVAVRAAVPDDVSEADAALVSAPPGAGDARDGSGRGDDNGADGDGTTALGGSAGMGPPRGKRTPEDAVPTDNDDDDDTIRMASSAVAANRNHAARLG